MNINLAYDTSFWELGVWLFPPVVILIIVLLFFARKALKSKRIFVEEHDVHEVKVQEALKAFQKEGISETEKATHNAEYNSTYTLSKAAFNKAESEGALHAALWSLAVSALVGAVMANLFFIEANDKNIDIENTANSINETYDVEVSKKEAENLMTQYSASGSNRGMLNNSDLDTKNRDWVTTQIYGTANILQGEDNVVVAQLVRIKDEFRLVYKKPGAKPEALVEVEKRNN